MRAKRALTEVASAEAAVAVAAALEAAIPPRLNLQRLTSNPLLPPPPLPPPLPAPAHRLPRLGGSEGTCLYSSVRHRHNSYPLPPLSQTQGLPSREPHQKERRQQQQRQQQH